MLNRRQFLTRTFQGSTLLAFGNVVPQFVASTAQAAEAGKDTILVVIEMTGGNDGLNTVIPYADDLYHKARPTLRYTKDQVVRVNDHIGLHPSLRNLEPMLGQGNLAIVQGVGYPNPNRSHFDSMDIWHSAEVGRKPSGTGWLARSVPDLQDKGGNVPVLQVGSEVMPLALQGAPNGVMTFNEKQPFRLNLNSHAKERRKLLEDLAQADRKDQGLLPFVQRRQVQTYTTLDRLEQLLKDEENNRYRYYGLGNLDQKMQLVSRMIQQDFGTRVYYLSLDGFDTHSAQAESHRKLMKELSNALSTFFESPWRGEGPERVIVMTFSEFGRRVAENGSRGTDHGAASCLFLAGPGVKGGPVGEHPSLADLDDGDLKYHTDFRRVYATLLDQWLGVDSRQVLGGKFEHLPLLKARA